MKVDYFNLFPAWTLDEIIRYTESVFDTALILIGCFAVGRAS